MYDEIIDPFTNKKYSIYESKGKQILNNYLRYIQNGGGNEGESCGYNTLNVNKYSNPCGQLPLDNDFLQYKGGYSKTKKRAFKKNRSRKH